ncbi:Tim44/TimA family putative adaptor protein [uncultured Sphingomonas sp.]|uniref:Tim44/TimA family putative adaptor protein n=1 Tax=uncultured Sphingomonas sp. TaxID=158754 RepID=UPI0025D2DEFC|nr:Tim44/TimA family putative adaptor protein [uncultured Sphingomonas sp.]
MTTIVVLALVFVFVALRLWSVLGSRTGHEQPLAKPVERPVAPRAVPLVGSDPAPAVGQVPATAPAAAAGLRTIASADPSFDAQRFVDGARSAYGMILEAFWRGDRESLAKLVDGEVADAFSHAITQREAAGETLDNRLVAVEQAEIEDARIEGQTAHIRIRFDADVAAVTRDRDGNVVAGSTTDAIPTHDVWTFSRAVKSPDPNWMLTETDEAA